MPRTLRAQLYKDSKGEFRWKRLAANNRTVGASTEGYNNKADCIDNALLMGVKKREIQDKT